MTIDALGSLYKDSAVLNGNVVFAAQGKQDSFSTLLKEARENQEPPASAQGVASPKNSKNTISAAEKAGKLYDQCRELETFVIKNLLEGLRKTVQKSEFMAEGFAGKMYEDMLYDEYAQNLSRNAGFGLADQAYLELSGRNRG